MGRIYKLLILFAGALVAEEGCAGNTDSVTIPVEPEGKNDKLGGEGNHPASESPDSVVNEKKKKSKSTNRVGRKVRLTREAHRLDEATLRSRSSQGKVVVPATLTASTAAATTTTTASPTDTDTSNSKTPSKLEEPELPEDVVKLIEDMNQLILPGSLIPEKQGDNVVKGTAANDRKPPAEDSRTLTLRRVDGEDKLSEVGNGFDFSFNEDYNGDKVHSGSIGVQRSSAGAPLEMISAILSLVVGTSASLIAL